MAAGIGTITAVSSAGEAPSAPIFADRLSFAGDGVYPTGGTPGFEALVQAKLNSKRTILAVIGQDCGDNHVEYDRANDKLKARVMSTGVEVANGVDLSGVTFNVLVISK